MDFHHHNISHGRKREIKDKKVIIKKTLLFVEKRLVIQLSR